MAITVLAFLACYIPPIFLRVWGRLRSDKIWWQGFLAHFCIFVPSGINPIIYCFRTRRFRAALKQLLEDPCGRSPFQETNQVQMAQWNIPCKIPRQAAANNRIVNEPEEASLAPRAHVTVDQRACCSIAAQRGRGHCKETKNDRSDSESSGLRKRKVKLTWMENQHIDSSEANSSSGEENPVVCGDLNTQQQVTVEVHPVPNAMTVQQETTIP